MSHVGNGERDFVDLSTFFTKLIAQRDGVPECEITSAYILAQRKKRFYPDEKYDIPLTEGLVYRTPNQLKWMSNLVDELLAHT